MAAVVDFIIAPKLRTNDDGRVPAEVCVILHPIKDFAHFQIGCSYNSQVFLVTAVSHVVVSFSAEPSLAIFRIFGHKESFS